MTDGEIIESTETMRLRIVIDDDPCNPREQYEHLCRVVTVPDQYYASVDREYTGPYAQAWSHYLDRTDRHRDATALFMRYVSILGGVAELHTPERGPVSVWYLTREIIASEGLTDPLACIKGERDEYRAWADGEVYGYMIEQLVTWHRKDTGDTMETWEQIDSCWGFYGYEYAVEAGRETWEVHTAP